MLFLHFLLPHFLFTEFSHVVLLFWLSLPIVFQNGFKFNYLFNSFPHTADFNHKDIQEIIWLVVGQSPFRDKLVFNSYDGIDVKGYMCEILKRISGVTWRYVN